MDNKQAAEFVSNMWDDSIIPEIAEYIKVPNKSPHFDPDWEANGHMETAVEMLETWCKTQPIKDMTIEVVRIEGRTPLLFIDIPGQSDEVVLLYGHYDKQPEFSGWDEDRHPWTPVIKDGKLYGRGGADDGYATFGSLTAIRALQEQGIPHAHCIVLVEGCEESGSFDLPYYIDHLEDRIGSPEPRRLPGRRMRKLRPALVHNIAARQPDWNTSRRCVDRRRTFRICGRNSPVLFSCPSSATQPYRR